ncbi:MAG TPA: serine/threonine-protein kinase [Phototrophicaceae bacterium]|nr:serine/threonine-protein kinase [Phototrophicaceae bacterium]
MTKKATTLTGIDTSSKDPLIGKQFGDYRLTSVLATGGMAKIYKAMDYRLQRPAAVKILSPEDVESDKTLTKRFQREAQAVAVLEHDNIITIYQYGEQDGVYFLAMKLIKGKDLAQELKRLHRSGHKMDVRRGLHIMEQVASALDFAHQAGIIHRDIKPSNILLDDNDKAILTDFGLVLRTSSETTLGTAFGTPRYIAPEQAISSNKAMPQSDIYSLAVILYEIICGETPFTGESPMEIALSHISDPPPPPRSKDKNIPEAVERELLKALEKEPEKRHRSAMDFIRAIKKAYGFTIEVPTLMQTPMPSPTPTNPSFSDSLMLPNVSTAKATATKAPRVSSRKTVLLLLALVVLLGAVATFVIMGGKDRVFSVGLGGAGAAVVLSYNDVSFTILNTGDYDLNVLALKFIRGGDGGYDDYSGDRIKQDTLPSGVCSRVVLERRTVSDTSGCVTEHSREILINEANLFWRKEMQNGDTVDTFTVQYDGRVIITCPTVARGAKNECRFNWPIVPTPELATP